MAATALLPGSFRRPGFRPTNSQPAYVTTASRRAAAYDLHAAADRRKNVPGIGRPAMRKTAPKPRDVDFERIRALDIWNNGPRLQLSKKTLLDLLTVSLPDPSDTNFLAEGRPQRLMSVARSLSDLAQAQARTGKDIQERLAVLRAWLDTGKDPSGAENDAIGAIVSQIIRNVRPEDLRPVDRRAVYDSLWTLDLAVHTDAARDINVRYVTQAVYEKNFPVLSVYLTRRAMALSANPALRPPEARGDAATYTPEAPVLARYKQGRQVIIKYFGLLDLGAAWKNAANRDRLLDVSTLEWVREADVAPELRVGTFGPPEEEEKEEHHIVAVPSGEATDIPA